MIFDAFRCLFHSNKYGKSNIYGCYIKNYNVDLSLLTVANNDYTFRLKLAIIKSTPDIFHFPDTLNTMR
jgi:hypothetical protein